jgi:hypothetical protein
LLVDYLYHANNLTFQLKNRGFDIVKLKKISNMVADLNRDDLLAYKPKQNSFNLIDNKTFIFKTLLTIT